MKGIDILKAAALGLSLAMVQACSLDNDSGGGSSNNAPVQNQTIADQSLVQGEQTAFNLTDVFSDPDNDALSFDASTDQSSLVSVSIAADGITLVISAGSTETGSANVTVIADDGQDRSSLTFVVTVTDAALDGPQLTTALPDYQLEVGLSRSTNLADHFEDAQTSDDDLVYAAAVDNTLVTVAVDQASNSLTVTAGQDVGTAIVTVTVTDADSNEVQDSFAVEVVAQGGGAISSQAIPDTEIPAGTSADPIDLSNFFSTSGSDPISYSVTRSNDNVTHVLTDSQLSLTAAGAVDSSTIFTVTATAGQDQAQRSFTATVITNEVPPETAVDAGADQSVNSGDPVALTATVTPEGTSVNFSWAQTLGQNVILSGEDTATLSFTAPEPLAENPTADQLLTFEVTITDSSNNVIDSDTVSVTVKPLPFAARPAQVYVAQNGDSSRGTIQRFVEATAGNQDLMSDIVFNSIENEGLALDILGNAVHIGDDNDDETLDVSGGISHICRIAQRVSDNTFSEDIDRNILATDTDNDGDIDNNTTLGRNPGAKGATLLHTKGYIAVADFAAQQVKLFGSANTGNIGPVSAVTLGAKPWDVAYDAGRDILYAAGTNGTVRVLDGYVASIEAGNAPTETRTMRMVDGSGAVVGVNLHGIAYEPIGDRLVISDVGATNSTASADFNIDGALYVLSDASVLNGDVAPTIIRNAALGNPVDLAIWGRDVLVAEKANDSLLLYKDVFTSAGGDIAPSDSVSLDKPESVAIEFGLDLPANGSDIPALAAEESSPVLQLLLTMQAGNGSIIHRLNAALGEQLDPPSFSLESALPLSGGIAVDVVGDVFAASYQEAGGPGSNAASRIDVIARLAESRMGTIAEPGTPALSRDRRFTYQGTALAGPDIAEPIATDLSQSTGLLFVADAAGSSIHVLSSCAEGAILASVALDDGDALTAENPTDIDFDESTGDLYVSLGGSRMAVFRDFHLNYQNDPSAVFIQLQVLDGGNPVAAAENLKAIEYVPGADALILSDLGATLGDATAEDGQILIIQAASNMSTAELVDVVIAGGASDLADPYDIAFDGRDLLVLDQANEHVARYPAVLNASSGDLAPTATTDLSALNGTPMSLALVPEKTSSRPDQIINLQ